MQRLTRVLAAAVLAALPLTPVVVGAQDVPAEIMACIANGTKAGRSYIQHADPAKLQLAVKAYQAHSSDYPEGTILRMIPGEAMVKRTKTAFPQSNGWEYFALTVTPQGTTVKARGYEASNPLGTCQNCHSGAKSDFVCASGGCANVPLTDERIAQIQAADPRCAK